MLRRSLLSFSSAVVARSLRSTSITELATGTTLARSLMAFLDYARSSSRPLSHSVVLNLLDLRLLKVKLLNSLYQEP